MCQVNLRKNLPWKKWIRTAKHSWTRCNETRLFWMEAYEYVIESQIMPLRIWQKPLVEISDLIKFGNSPPNSLHGATVFINHPFCSHTLTRGFSCASEPRDLDSANRAFVVPGTCSAAQVPALECTLPISVCSGYIFVGFSVGVVTPEKSPLLLGRMCLILFYSLAFGSSFNLINYLVLSWL